MAPKEIVNSLRISSVRVGRLYPVLFDKNGNVVDGQHRLRADANWPRFVLDDIQDEEHLILARLVSNVCRRRVSAKEKQDMLAKLGRIYLENGIRLGKLANIIADRTGMSYRWVMKYLPDSLKLRPGIGAIAGHKSKENRRFVENQAAHRAAQEYVRLLCERREKVVALKSYSNTNFVNLLIDRDLHTRFVSIALCLGIDPDVLVGNILLLEIQRIEKLLRQNHPLRELLIGQPQ